MALALVGVQKIAALVVVVLVVAVHLLLSLTPLSPLHPHRHLHLFQYLVPPIQVISVRPLLDEVKQPFCMPDVWGTIRVPRRHGNLVHFPEFPPELIDILV